MHEFSIGDEPQRSPHKEPSCSMYRSLQVPREIGLNFYKLDIPWDLSVITIFNGEDLTHYRALVYFLATITEPSFFFAAAGA